jgi:hypothetical protein
MRVMAKYYTRIHTKRMASLLDLSQEVIINFNIFLNLFDLL